MSKHLLTWRTAWLPLFFLVAAVEAQTNPPPATYVRSFVNDIPNQPLISVAVAGASNVTCLTIEETLPAPASPLNISGDGVYLPAQNAIRWGPYFNTVATNVSYRLTGMPGSYPINGGAWMDGHWYFSTVASLVTVLPANGSGVPSAPVMVTTPVFSPANGAGVPTNITISCLTTGAVIYYTLDGSLPTQSSILYTGSVALASASVVRARAFTNGWTPSVAAVAYYGPTLVANATVARNVNTNLQLITFTVRPSTNAFCVTLEEALPFGLGASNVSAGGSYLASNNVVRWGPFFGTNVQNLSYQAIGPSGTYALHAAWSVDGVGGIEATGTNIVLVTAGGNIIPTPPPQVAAPAFSPASGTNVPVSVTITDATPGAVIYYTLDGSLPTPSSLLVTGPVTLASAGVVRARGFTNGWLPSVASVAYYGPPAAVANAQVVRSINLGTPATPVVTFSVVPGAGAKCVAVTETLPPGVSAVNVSSGGNFVASNNVVLWGPFLGTNAVSLSYQAVGLPGVYPVSASWSVDGFGGSDFPGTNLVIGGAGAIVPSAPARVPTPVLTPAGISGLPVTVAISDSDGAAQIFYTTDGTLPTQNSALYTGPVTLNAQTALRAVAFHSGYLPSVAAVGEFDAAATTASVAAVSSLYGNGSFLPTISLTATPQSSVSCYAITEEIPLGLMPSGISSDGIWDPLASAIRWGPYADNQARYFSFNLGGASGTYPLAGQVSFNGFTTAASGATSVQINANYSGSAPVTNLAACASDYLTYNVNINPAPGVVTVTNAVGTVNWGDGTQTSITQPVMSLQKQYSAAGTYSIAVSANWSGFSGATFMSGLATKTDSIQVVTTCLAPQIVTQPTSQAVLAGATALFTVSASSSVPMTYQWYLNTNLPIYASSTFAALTLPNVTPQSAGRYSVVITNAFGSVTSSVVSLSVFTPVVNSIVRSANGRITLAFSGLPNTSTRIWSTTNLASPTSWLPLFTNTTTTTNGTWQFTDTNATGSATRFYRFSTP